MSSPYTSWGGPDRDLARAVTGAHADYHREIQQHTAPDGLVDDVVTHQMLAPHLMRTVLFLVTPTVLLLLKLVIDYLAAMSSPDAVTDVVSTLLGLLVVVLYVAGIASFFAPAKEPIAEHARLLENHGDAAANAYEYVRLAAAARRSPAEVTPSTVAGVPVLLFRQYSERAMLLVQPYGDDLYVGWTMWRSRSTATLLVHFLRDTFGRFAPSPRFSAELRAAATRALRESIHSLSREGVAAALHADPACVPHPAEGRPQGEPDADDRARGRTGSPGPARPGTRPTGPSNTRTMSTESTPTGTRTAETRYTESANGSTETRHHEPPPPGDPPRDGAAAEPTSPGEEREPRPTGALPTAAMPADQQAAWTGAAAGDDREAESRDGERVAARRPAREQSRDDARNADEGEGWGPPPRDRW